MDALTVACVLRSGGDFVPEHVAMLRDQVAHWMPGVRFVCLSDVDVPCETLHITKRLRGFWAKLEMFRLLKGPTLYFDLDTLIMRDPMPLTQCGKFVSIRNWYKGTKVASGVMYYDGDYSFLHDQFDPKSISRYSKCIERLGDQAYIEEMIGDDMEFFPEGMVVSFKRHCEHGVPNDALVIAFHGKPRPWNVEKQWVRQVYARTAA